MSEDGKLGIDEIFDLQARISELEERAHWFVPGHSKRVKIEQELEKLKEALANG